MRHQLQLAAHRPRPIPPLDQLDNEPVGIRRQRAQHPTSGIPIHDSSSRLTITESKLDQRAAIMPTLIDANRAFCGEFQTKVGMPAGSALRLPCRRRHGNRFLLVAVAASGCCPMAARLDGERSSRLRDRIRAALRARPHRAGELTLRPRTPGSGGASVYPQLSAAQPGLLGAATARAEAHVIRLALIYAAARPPRRDPPRAPRSRARVWRYSARLRPLDLRRHARRPARRRDLRARQGPPRRPHPHRDPRRVQPFCGAPQNGCSVPGSVMWPAVAEASDDGGARLGGGAFGHITLRAT